ncbi:5'/3'-nucleotidase SurE [Desulfovibrio mangrovi]|uniref:5'/3'-nucleotidase SurE n=1 Tax=Desulfovibrio mangrovi TaxID=2976983 RepID=UPI0022482A8A|nr:5'/3'-nucleotidase SurE [Desulfovibrio mangrovi]UZP67835.1 5'/3'-nucleotidase SurE [Desulfovibrio mangrovi]
MSKYKILITNDDGIDSPGLAAVIQAVNPLAELLIVAPLVQQTAMGRAQRGNATTGLMKRILHVDGRDFEAFACDAAPARVVNHALSVFPGYRPDLVISGINYGENLGASVTSSGTVGAAIEGACRGIPSIAVSLETQVDTHFVYSEQDWGTSKHFLKYFTERTLQHGFPAGVDVLKIDVPSTAAPDCPWRTTRLSKSLYYRQDIPEPSVTSLLGDVIVSKETCAEEPTDTDVYALAIDRVVSVTPMTIDLTARNIAQVLRGWGERG